MLIGSHLHSSQIECRLKLECKIEFKVIFSFVVLLSSFRTNFSAFFVHKFFIFYSNDQAASGIPAG